MKKITIWYRYDAKQKIFKHNHIDDGGWVIDSGKPHPESEKQKTSWQGARWAKEFAYMEGSTVKHLNEV